jgi:hypothetical protein
MSLSSDCIRFIRRSLSPIQFRELVGDVVDRQLQLAIGIVSAFDRQFHERDQQGVLVGRDERAFRQDALDVGYEPYLVFR